MKEQNTKEALEFISLLNQENRDAITQIANNKNANNPFALLGLYLAFLNKHTKVKDYKLNDFATFLNNLE